MIPSEKLKIYLKSATENTQKKTVFHNRYRNKI